MMTEAIGLECSIGDVCEIHRRRTVRFYVVGIADKVTHLCPTRSRRYRLRCP